MPYDDTILAEVHPAQRSACILSPFWPSILPNEPVGGVERATDGWILDLRPRL